MDGYNRIKMRGERLKKMMDDTLSPDRAWETMHPPHSPPKRYPHPNFLTNPDVNDPRNFAKSGGNLEDEDDDEFYDYLSEDDDKDRRRGRRDRDEEDKDDHRTDDRRKKQHAVDDEDHLARVRELERKKKLDDIRDKVNRDAHHNLLVHQINQTRTVDPFAKLPEMLVLQLYLRIYGAMYIDPRDIAIVQDSSQKLSEMNVFRNTYIQYKDFPKGNTQRTPIFFNTNSPLFNYKAYFPIVVREDTLLLMSKFLFLFEVWDQVTPDKHAHVGFAKLPLSCFFKSLVFQENGLLNTAYFEDDSNQYPMVGFDDNAEIIDLNGKCVGWLKLTVALGNPNQINRFDSIQAERDRARAEEEEEKRRHDKRRKKREEESGTEAGRNKEIEKLLRELIDTLKDKSSSGGKREKGRWADNQLDSLRKFYEECRLENTKDIKQKVFKESMQTCKNTKKIPKKLFESDLLDNTALNRKTVDNILQIWNYNQNELYDIDQLQTSYLIYCRYCNYAESKIKSIFKKLQTFFQLTEDDAKQKKKRDDDDEDEILRNKNIAALWCKDDEMKEGFNLIVDLFKGNGDPDQSINMEEFLGFIKSPPFVNRDHISLIAMKHDILTKKVVADMKKDFTVNIAEDLLEAGNRDDFLADPILCVDFHEKCHANDLELCIWEVLVFFEHINQTSRNEPDRYHVCKVNQILQLLDHEDVWDKYEDTELEKRRVIAAKKKKREEANPRRSLEGIDDVLDGDREEIKRKSPKKPHKVDHNGSGIFDREDMDEEDDIDRDDEDEIFDILNDTNLPNKDKEERKKPQGPTKVSPKPPPRGDRARDSAEFVIGKKDYTEHIDEDRKFEHVKTVKTKHIFEVNVKELKNVPILKMILKDLNRGDRESQSKAENKYIQNVFVKYIFPLDDEQIVSDYIEFSPKGQDTMDYNVSMHSYHTYLLETHKSVVDSLKK